MHGMHMKISEQLERVGFLLYHVSLLVIKLGSKYLYLVSYPGPPG